MTTKDTPTIQNVKRHNPHDSRTRWNGATFPAQDAATLARLARYPRTALSTTALFAVAMSDFDGFLRHGRTAARPAAE